MLLVIVICMCVCVYIYKFYAYICIHILSTWSGWFGGEDVIPIECRTNILMIDDAQYLVVQKAILVGCFWQSLGHQHVFVNLLCFTSVAPSVPDTMVRALVLVNIWYRWKIVSVNCVIMFDTWKIVSVNCVIMFDACEQLLVWICVIMFDPCEFFLVWIV